MFTSRKLKKIKNLIIENGGGTLNAKTLKNADYLRGYMVSLAGYEKQLKIENLTIKTIKLYQKNAQRLHANVGFWIDNNILYLDISKHFISKDKAVRTALKNNQLALYDIYNAKSVFLKDIKTKRVQAVKFTF